MKRLFVIAAAALVVVAASFAVESDRSSVGAASSNYEVWVADQGTDQVHVLRPDKNDLELVATIDFPPLSKPHMILFGLHGRPGSRYGYVSNVGSGNTSVIDAEARAIVAVIPTGVRTHASQPSPDGRRALSLALGPAPCSAAPDCGQITEILTDTDNGVFTPGRTFRYSNLAALAPDKASLLLSFNPVCGSFTPDSRYFYVTFSSGGLAIFEVNDDPDLPLFNVVDILGVGTGAGQIAPNGCGIGYSVDGRLMFANSATATQSFYYVFDIATHTLIKSEQISDVVSDVHGMMLDPDGKDVVMAGRLSDNFIVINQKNGELRANKTFSSSPGDAPDLTDFSPDGKWLYVTLRGPHPATTGAHPNPGLTPGVLVVTFSAGKVERIVELPGDPQVQDPHGIAVRRLN